jgi:uroporphyrinogen decarboxylase
MTGKERIGLILKRKKTDRIGIYEHFWPDTQKEWLAHGFKTAGDEFEDFFGFDIYKEGAFNLFADPAMEFEKVEETEDTWLRRDGNFALLRWPKHHAGTPEHVDFLAKDYSLWKKHIKPLLLPTENRINFETYVKAMKHAQENDRFFLLNCIQVFEIMKNVSGHELMLIGMAEEPEWITDMTSTYSELIINLMEILFSKCGKPDGIYFPEDMGFKLHPFMSPAMYREFLFPAHKKTIDYLHSIDVPVIMHSCGFVEPLLPYMVEAGIDCLQAMEVKAGMDPVRIYKQYGGRISLMGGIDTRVLCSNNRELIDRELQSKIPVLKQGNGYILMSDHSIPNTVKYDTYRYFLEQGIKLGKMA